jgi:hypothetical protein
MMPTHSPDHPRELAGDTELPMDLFDFCSSAVVEPTGEIFGELTAARGRKPPDVPKRL